ncbi:probable prolyl 4-hydroxylase 3 isoform X2 [Prosopis cineraria]|uniref:probable prolyl 4-hydroxylase 3 isoform X2 n=1 Tax=Prosopis cineraria TaxID=364024 RepID=UPI00240F63B3|nr:probable prolyl 4-hydroxylase 3 isoform X2 [Prosopis cineraria]
MARGKFARSQGKKWSIFTLVFFMLFMLSTVLLMLLALGIVSLPITDDSLPTDLSAFRRKISERGDGLGERGQQWTEVLSWEPRAFIYHNFLSKEECEYLISLAKPFMAKSTVVDSQTGQSKDSRVRTSSGMFLKRGRDRIIRNIEKRIADFTFIPRMEKGFRFSTMKLGRNMSLTMITFSMSSTLRMVANVLLLFLCIYVEEGGETVFPAAKANFSSVPWWNELSECGKKGLSVKPKMGDALLFWSMRPHASLDPASLHGGCPVISGNKWSSTKWLHLEEYKV